MKRLRFVAGLWVGAVLFLCCGATYLPRQIPDLTAYTKVLLQKETAAEARSYLGITTSGSVSYNTNQFGEDAAEDLVIISGAKMTNPVVSGQVTLVGVVYTDNGTSLTRNGVAVTSDGTGNWTASGTTNSTLAGEARVHSLVATNSIMIGTNVITVSGGSVLLNGVNVRKKEIGGACSDETTALTTGTGKLTFRMPYAMTLTGVRANLKTAQTGGSIFTVDINEAGVSLLSTKITIDNGEKTSTTAAAAPVISDTALADDAEITIDIDQVGDGTAKGLKIWLIGTEL